MAKNAVSENVSFPFRWNKKAHSDPSTVPTLLAPSSLTTTITGYNLTLSWVDNTGGIGQVSVERSPNGSTSWSEIAVVRVGTNTYDQNLTPGTYFYRVRSISNGYYSPYSSVVNATILSGSEGISSITGSISNGASVTVNGAGFGTMGGDVLWFAYGTEGANNTLITSATPTIGSPAGAQNGSNCLFSNVRTRPGRTMSMRKWRTNPSGTTVNFAGFGPNNVHQPQLFFSFWRNASMDITWSASGTNYKMYYIFANGFFSGSGGSEKPQPIFYVPAGSNTFVMGANGASGDSDVVNTAGWNAVNSLGSWQLYENWIKMNSDYGVQDGEFDVWRNGVLGLSDHTYAWFGVRADWTTKPTHFEDVRIGHYDQGMTGFVADYSDLYVASTRARVVLGNASTWSACTAREIQLARNANWTDTAISDVVFNYGAFTSGQTVYLYVVKSDGSVVNTSGYAVVLP